MCEGKVTNGIEGLNFDMPEACFMERFARFRQKRLPAGHDRIVGIRFIYFYQKEMKGAVRTKKERP